MEALSRKKIAVILKYVTDTFSLSDWYMLGQLTGKLDLITGHGRLLRAFDFGDPDYAPAAIEVLNSIFSHNEQLIDEVIEHFDIALWYQQKEPEKYSRLFLNRITASPDFWKSGYLKAFVSHLSSDKERMSHLKASLEPWGVCAFIAHEDIQPSREWRNEVEAALDTMDALIAVVQPGFKESDWCSQEVGYALGRKVEIVPVKAGLDPFGFFGKYQAIPAKGKLPSLVAQEIVLTLLRKPMLRDLLLQSMSRALATLATHQKVGNVQTLDSWKIVSDDQLKVLLEGIALSEIEKSHLAAVVARTKAFSVIKVESSSDEDVPF